MDSPLRKARKERGIGLREMSKVIEYDRGDLSRVEREMTPARTVEWVANRYELYLGIERGTLVRECGTLPATLASAVSDMLEYVSRLMVLPFPRHQAPALA